MPPGRNPEARESPGELSALLGLLGLLLVGYGLLSIAALIRPDAGLDTSLRGRIALALVFAFTALGHFIKARSMAEMLPPWVPGRVPIVRATVGGLPSASPAGPRAPGRNRNHGLSRSGLSGQRLRRRATRRLRRARAGPEISPPARAAPAPAHRLGLLVRGAVVARGRPPDAALRSLDPLKSSSGRAPYLALRHRDYRRLLVSQFFSLIGSQMQVVAINWHVYLLTRSPLALGFVGLTRAVPIVLFALGGRRCGQEGPAAHHARGAGRHDRRGARPGGIHVRAPGDGLLLYGLNLCAASAVAFDGPARQALIPRLVPTEDYRAPCR